MTRKSWDVILQHELRHGRERILEARWLDWNDWDRDTIITSSKTQPYLRLVLLVAKEPGKGAFTRLIANIKAEGLQPTLVEPSQSLIDWCNRHDWRSRIIGRNADRQTIYYPRGT